MVAPVAAAIPAIVASAIHMPNQRSRSRRFRAGGFRPNRRGAGGGGCEGKGEAEGGCGERAQHEGLEACFHGSLHCATPDLRLIGWPPSTGRGRNGSGFGDMG